MVRKLLSLVLVISMTLGLFASCAAKQHASNLLQDVPQGVTVEEDDESRVASTVVEGVLLKCEHKLNTEQYWLYLDETSYELDVAIFDDYIEVDFKDNITLADYEEKVVGQVLLASFATVGLMEAAKTIIAVAAGITITANVFIAVDAIGDTITGVRSNSNTYRYARTIDMTAADAIRFGRLSRNNAYFSAYLSSRTGKVMVGQQISRWNAVWRLETGNDVFATSMFAAHQVAYEASTIKSRMGAPHDGHVKQEGYYPHFHPYGRKWVNNPNHSPHSWYPY